MAAIDKMLSAWYAISLLAHRHSAGFTGKDIARERTTNHMPYEMPIEVKAALDTITEYALADRVAIANIEHYHNCESDYSSRKGKERRIRLKANKLLYRQIAKAVFGTNKRATIADMAKRAGVWLWEE
jgi:hypothetical protein